MAFWRNAFWHNAFGVISRRRLPSPGGGTFASSAGLVTSALDREGKVWGRMQVYANDLNPRSFHWLQKNITLNKV